MKNVISKLCCISSIILIACFIIKTVIDYGKYSSTLNSAPFYIWILINTVYFILPALIIFIVGFVLKKKR